MPPIGRTVTVSTRHPLTRYAHYAECKFAIEGLQDDLLVSLGRVFAHPIFSLHFLISSPISNLPMSCRL
jgi:hypothetical protein